MADTFGDDPDLDRLTEKGSRPAAVIHVALLFCTKTNRIMGWCATKTDPNAPVSIAAVGMALATIPVVVERGVVLRDFASKEHAETTALPARMSPGSRAGRLRYKGFFYHFLDIENGRRVWQCELSTIDSAFLFAGALTVGTYFDRDTPDEVEIRSLADTLYRRGRLELGRDGGPTLTHGWRPRTGSSDTAGKDTTKDCCCTSSGSVRQRIRCPPRVTAPIARPTNGRKSTIVNCSTRALFTHQLSHMWIDFRGIRDDSCRPPQRLLREQPACDVRAAGVCDPQSREFHRLRRTLLGIHGMRRARLGEACGQRRRTRVFRLHRSRAPFGPDDGTVAPWVVVASLPFAPEIVIPTVRQFARMDLGMTGNTGSSHPSINRLAAPESPTGWWVSP
jgi:hypothetical protein